MVKSEGGDSQFVPPGRLLRSPVINGIEITPEKRLPHLDHGAVKAYEARPAGAVTQANFFALICEPQFVPQASNTTAYAAIVNPALVRLIASGPVFWPPDNRFRYCFVYENNLGRPLQAAPDQEGLGMRPDHLIKAVVKPLISALTDLRNADLVHGCINPANVFDGGDKVVEKAVLGEYLSAPPGLFQPSVYETLDRALCMPVARGPGTFADDLYAFGATIAFLLRKKNPLEGLTDDQIIEEKMEVGSFAALVGKERITGPLLELLRGLLYDDRDQRWTIEEVHAWDDGQHLSPKQSARKKKAARPFHFNGEQYFRQSLLARDLARNQSEAVQKIDNGDLEQWVSRSLEDAIVKTRLEQAVTETAEQGRGPGYWDRLLSHVAIALHPSGPIRFKGLAMHPEGIGNALAEAFVLKKDFQPFADIINQQLVLFWVGAQTELRIDVGSLVSRFDSARAFLRQPNLGYGMERCLYSLHPHVPCLSERIAPYYVRSPEDLMYALDAMADEPNRPELFIDRHIAAFLSVRDRKMIDMYMADLNAPEFHRRVLGNIKTAATIQKRSRMEAFPGLARWAVEILDPVYERYHDRELRASLRKKVEALKESGDLGKIVATIDQAELQQSDFLAFRQAMQDHADLREEEAELTAKLDRPEVFGRETGTEVAAIISGVIAGIFILFFSFLFLMKKGIL